MWKIKSKISMGKGLKLRYFEWKVSTSGTRQKLPRTPCAHVCLCCVVSRSKSHVNNLRANNDDYYFSRSDQWPLLTKSIIVFHRKIFILLFSKRHGSKLVFHCVVWARSCDHIRARIFFQSSFILAVECSCEKFHNEINMECRTWKSHPGLNRTLVAYQL